MKNKMLDIEEVKKRSKYLGTYGLVTKPLKVAKLLKIPRGC